MGFPNISVFQRSDPVSLLIRERMECGSASVPRQPERPGASSRASDLSGGSWSASGAPRSAINVSSWEVQTGKGPSRQPLPQSLQAADYRVRLYTSPHRLDFRERIRVDGAMIPEEILCRRIGQVRRANREGVTYFEFATALAFLHFARCRVNVAVIEVGLGGRLDATNVIRPELSPSSPTSPWTTQNSWGRALKTSP